MTDSEHPIRVDLQPTALQLLRERFGDRLQTDAPMARYTAARLGGPADGLMEVHSIPDLVEVVKICWIAEYPCYVLGGGSNLLVSDRGVRGMVVINRSRRVRFDEQRVPPQVWAESGANFGLLARQAAERGLSGLEWASGIPGAVGGALVNNAGAHGADMAGNLHLAEILHREIIGDNVETRLEEWPVDRLAYAYRSSYLKQNPGEAVVLSATLNLQASTPESVQSKMDELALQRRSTQPPGASMGSMFKNPVGEAAGRLIDAAGLKGMRVGDAQISPLHANFFINLGQATAQDFYQLIQQARQEVVDRFGIELELEVELMGEWCQNDSTD